MKSVDTYPVPPLAGEKTESGRRPCSNTGGRRTSIRNQISGSVASGSTVALRQQLLAHRRKRAKGVPKASTVAIYASIFALIVAVVAIGYRPPQETGGVANASPVSNELSSESTSVDEVVAATVAANLAQSTNLSVAPNTLEFAVSAQTKSEFLQTADTSVITKPQILQPTAENRTVESYTANAGDTVTSVAAKYGIAAETLKWANNLTSEALSVGKVLTILPVDGIQYTVKAGDTLESISTKYGVDQTRVVLYNDLDVSGIVAGQKLILPGANLPNTERPGYVAPVAYDVGYSAGFSGNTWRIKIGTSMLAGNTYSRGYCTAYAYDRRIELGLPVSASWGNANTWDNLARATRPVDRTPSVGAIVQNDGGFGHVAIVENILPNGDIEISEMNASVGGGGWNIVSGRIITAAYVSQYVYIH